MGRWIEILEAIWIMCIGWMPPLLATICTVAIIIMFIFLIVKLIGFILDAIPFL